MSLRLAQRPAGVATHYYDVTVLQGTTAVITEQQCSLTFRDGIALCNWVFAIPSTAVTAAVTALLRSIVTSRTSMARSRCRLCQMPSRYVGLHLRLSMRD